MPPHRTPPSLRQLSEAELVSSLTLRWPDGLEGAAAADVLRVLSGLPPALVDAVAARLVERFSRVAARTSPRLVAALLEAVCARGLRTLDLSPLVRLGSVEDEEEDLRRFERSLATLLPSRLAGLDRLRLATHKNEFTLPSCSDALLAVLSRHCGALTALDLSCCNLVTDDGLALVAAGCPRLHTLLVFECSVTADGVAHALLRLPELRLLDYRDLATPIAHIHRRDSGVRLKLSHVSHVGFLHTALHKLQFHEGVARAVSLLCPDVTHLRVRVTDYDVARLCGLFPGLRSLELVFNVGAPTSPGEGLRGFLTAGPPHGPLLTTLALACNVLHADQCVLIARACLKLRQLWLRCNHLVCDATWRPPTTDDSAVFTRLDTFYVKVGETERCEGFVPARLLSFLLRDAGALSSLQLVMRSDHVDDAWLGDVLGSLRHTQELSKVLVAVPRLNSCRGSLRLTQASVELLLARCPALRTLGNLLVWNLSHRQYLNLRDALHAGNYDINLVYRHMKVT